jgi:tetratricopeptide (TPR) repeat protein
LKRNPRDWRAWKENANVLELLGRFEEAAGSLHEARKILEETDRKTEQWYGTMRTLAGAPPWIRTLYRGDTYWRMGAYSRAGEYYERGIREANATGDTQVILSTRVEGAEASFAKSIFINAHVTLARIQTAASVGRWAKRSPLREVPAGEAERLRAAAVATLNRALELGLDYLGRIEKDSDFDPLRDRPGFKALLQRGK